MKTPWDRETLTSAIVKVIPSLKQIILAKTPIWRQTRNRLKILVIQKQISLPSPINLFSLVQFKLKQAILKLSWQSCLPQALSFQGRIWCPSQCPPAWGLTPRRSWRGPLSHVPPNQCPWHMTDLTGFHTFLIVHLCDLKLSYNKIFELVKHWKWLALKVNRKYADPHPIL